MLTVWGRRNSLNVQKVLWLVGELGLDYDHRPAGGAEGGLDTPAFRALNPHGRIPVIQDGEATVWESHAILRYLAAKHPAGGFWRDDPADRAQAEQWMDWSATSLQPTFLNGVFWGWYRTPEDQPDGPAVAKALAQSNAFFSLLDARLADRSFVAGKALSLADIPIGALLYRYFELQIARPVLPHLEAWYEVLKQRPAYREHVMIPFDDMRGRLSY